MNISAEIRQIVREEIEAALAGFRPIAQPHPTSSGPRVLNVKAIADEYGLHENTARIALQDGSLHGFQRAKGGRWHARRECVDAWLSGTRCEHQAERRG